MSGVAKLASPDPSVHSLTQACAELGHSSRTVTGRSFTVANRVRSRTFATLLLHEVYLNATPATETSPLFHKVRSRVLEHVSARVLDMIETSRARSSGDPFLSLFLGLALVSAGISLATDGLVIPRTPWAGALLVVAGLLMLAVMVLQWRSAKRRRRGRTGSHEKIREER